MPWAASSSANSSARRMSQIETAAPKPEVRGPTPDADFTLHNSPCYSVNVTNDNR